MSRVVAIFRNDDLSASSDAEHERAVAAVFERYGLPQTVGVVPFVTRGDERDPRPTQEMPLSENEAVAEFLRDGADRLGWEMALHGYSHRTNRYSLPRRREFFEFRRISRSDQADLIRRGTDMLTGTLRIVPQTFIPPWNRLDHNTLGACLDNGYRIVSGACFVPTLPGLTGLGTECGVEEFPERLRIALDGDRLIVIRVLLHSANIRTRREWADLEESLRLAAAEPHCEVLTIQEAVRRYPHEIRDANAAAVNVVLQADLLGSVRARAAIYRKAMAPLNGASQIEKAYETAKDLYLHGEYEQAASMGVRIDRLSKRLVGACRVVAAALGFLSGAGTVAAVSGWGVSGGLWWLAGLLALTLLAGLYAWMRGTARDTKREMLVITALALLGQVVAGAGVEVVRRLAGP